MIILHASRIARDCLHTLIRGPWKKDEILQQIATQGVGSVPIVVVATAFAGLVITQEIAFHMDHALHTTSMIPGFTAQFILRELGIAVPAFLLVSKVGASMTAEIGGMKVTEQIEALQLLGIDPVKQLVFPRWIAGILSTLALTLLAMAVTLFCAIVMAVLRYHFSWQEYLNTLRHFVGLKDLLAAMVKALTYGAVIPLIACTYGFRCEGGAQGVGSATTQSVVTATIAVIVLDFVLTYLFTLIA
jgi:phospholipid/cholesterol/gamma-HCH transport system permease protein